MSVLSVLVAASAAVLLGAGLAKLLQPDGTISVLRALGAPSPHVAARVLGVGEMLLGAATLLVAGRALTALLTVTWLAAAATVLAARRSGLGSCGCFGDRSPPPRGLHAVVDLGCAAAAAVGTAVGTVPVADLAAEASGPGAVGVVAATVAVAVALLLLSTAAPRQVP